MNMRTDVLISVIIPTYKNRGGLQGAVDSVLRQDYTDFEVIVVDDNEPSWSERQDTEMLMTQYADNKKVIYVKHSHNRNGAAARNTGIRIAKGDYIAFLDDDDVFLPSKLRIQLNYLVQHPQYDAVYCFAKKGGKLVKAVPFEGDVSKQLLLLKSKMFTPTLMFRREALLTIHGFDETFIRHQDYELLLKFFAHGYKIGCVKECLTMIGQNRGENEPSGEKLERLKRQYFSKCASYIDKYEGEEHGFKKKVYALHYAGVFLNHVKHRHIIKAFRTFGKYFFYSPQIFMKVLKGSVIAHLK